MRKRMDINMRKCIIACMNPSEAITHLKQAGLTEKAIGLAVGANQSTINRIANGTQPNYELGKALIDLAQQTPLQNAA
jgi:predicted XRE-type DNA-binding protein